MILSKIATLVFYTSVFLLVFAFGYLSKKTQKRIFVILSILLPAVIIALRFRTGSDTENYKAIFDSLNSLSFGAAISQAANLAFEPFTILTARLSHLLGFGYFFFFFSHSALTFLMLYSASQRFSKKHSWLLFGALCIVIFPYCLNSMRQSLASATLLLILSRNSVKANDIFKDLLLFLFMIFCHFSAFLLLPVILLCLLLPKIEYKNLYFCTAIIIACSVAASPIIISFITSHALLPPKYLEMLNVSGVGSYNFDFFIFLSINLFLFLTRFINNSFTKYQNNELSIISLCSLFYTGLGFFSTYVARMSDYFWPVACIAIWLCIDRFKDTFKFKAGLYACILFIYFVITCFLLNINEIVPYGIMP